MLPQHPLIRSECTASALLPPLDIEALAHHFEDAAATILLVDDDASIRVLTAAILEHRGYKVAEAGSGPEALCLIERGLCFDILVLDFEMPGMNGRVLADAIKKGRPRLPVLYVTAYGREAELAGVARDDIIEKPYRDGDLGERIQSLLKK